MSKVAFGAPAEYNGTSPDGGDPMTVNLYVFLPRPPCYPLDYPPSYQSNMLTLHLGTNGSRRVINLTS